MKIKFRAKNTGDGHYLSSPIEINYAITGQVDHPFIAQGKITTYNITIAAGQEVDIGEIIINKEKDFNYDSVLINVTTKPLYSSFEG